MASSDSSRYAPLGERLVRLEAARLARCRAARAPRARRSERVAKLRDDTILQLEHVLEQAVRLCVRKRLAGGGVHHACRDPEPIPRALEAAHHGEIEMQISPQRRQIDADPAHGLHHAHAVDDAQRRGGAEIVGDGFGDPG